MTPEIKPLFHLTLTSEEKNVLVQLLDIAVKSAGLQVANAALVLAQRIQNAPELAPVGEALTPRKE